MNFSELGFALRRRWYVSLLGLVATLGLLAVAMELVPANYVAHADVILIPPSVISGEAVNPYMALGNVYAATPVLARAMGDTDAVNQVAARGGADSYVVEPDPSAGDAVLQIASTGRSSSSALRTTKTVVEVVPAVLRQLQEAAGVKSAGQISSRLLAVDKKATIQRKSQMRAVLVAGVFGLVATLIACMLLDGLLKKRRVRVAPRRVETSVGSMNKDGRPAPSAVSELQPPAFRGRAK